MFIDGICKQILEVFVSNDERNLMFPLLSDFWDDKNFHFGPTTNELEKNAQTVFCKIRVQP